MNTRIFKIVLVVILTITFSCNKNEAKLPDFKYADQPKAVDCKTGYDDVLNEALYAFENDIVNKYDPKTKNKLRAYRAYISNVISNRTNLEQTVTAHSKALYDVLKTKPELWDNNHLNYNNEAVKCIMDNIKDTSLKQTLNALVENTDSNRISELFSAPLTSNTSYSRDTYLATFIALDLYYSKFNSVDFSTVDLTANEPKPQPIDFNKKPVQTPVLQPKQPQQEIDHTGHNHD
ncbi:hypothetical protein [Olleya sp. YS]|uniref:hypothetical protein n=1 Tax=Olleya sp. YS TaxID=3028318 RepID=UPI00243459D9|nr:hypothetical protein [Olleya sp. YS]WGD35055.1 hypothetical protein Ollyesu_01245 [Olleya sp. YS]